MATAKTARNMPRRANKKTTGKGKGKGKAPTSATVAGSRKHKRNSEDEETRPQKHRRVMERGEIQQDIARGMSEDEDEEGSNQGEWAVEGMSEAAEMSQVEGMKRDAWWREADPVFTEEQEVACEQVEKRIRARLAWYKEDPTRWFGPEYHLCREYGLNNWRDVFANLQDMPAGWPGTNLEHGLRDEHLSPRFWRHVYKGGDRNECGERIGLVGKSDNTGFMTIMMGSQVRVIEGDTYLPPLGRETPDTILGTLSPNPTSRPPPIDHAGVDSPTDAFLDFEQGGDCTTPPKIPIMRLCPPSISPSPNAPMTRIRKTAVGQSLGPGPHGYRSKSESSGWSSPIDVDDYCMSTLLPSSPFESSQSRQYSVTPHSPSSQPVREKKKVRNTSSTSQAQGSSTPHPSPGRKVFILKSRTKFRSHSLSPSVLELYTPSTLLLKMDTLGIGSMDEGNPLKILEFFAEVCLISPLFESRDQKMDIRGIPGYENVLKDWVKKNALGPIPSETATSHLRAKPRKKLKKIAVLIKKVTRNWPWDLVWKDEPQDERLRAVFFIARCWQWATISSD